MRGSEQVPPRWQGSGGGGRTTEGWAVPRAPDACCPQREPELWQEEGHPDTYQGARAANCEEPQAHRRELREGGKPGHVLGAGAGPGRGRAVWAGPDVGLGSRRARDRAAERPGRAEAGPARGSGAEPGVGRDPDVREARRRRTWAGPRTRRGQGRGRAPPPRPRATQVRACPVRR